MSFGSWRTVLLTGRKARVGLGVVGAVAYLWWLNLAGPDSSTSKILQSPHVQPTTVSRLATRCRTNRSADVDIMPIAHLISAHHPESIHGMAVLLEELFTPEDSFVIHVKAGVKSELLDQLVEDLGECVNIRFVPDALRVDSGYAVYSIVEMEVAMLKEALQMPTEWKYAIFLDGSSWPTMSLESRRQWFSGMPENSSSTFRMEKEKLITSCSEKNEGVCARTPARCIDDTCEEMDVTPGHLPVARYEQWVRLSYELSNWIVNDPSVMAWNTFFAPTAVPDEHYFGTLHWASPYRSKNYGVSYMYTDWAHTADCRSYKNERPNWSPCYLGPLEYDDIIDSGKPFARKFLATEVGLRKLLNSVPYDRGY